MLCVIVESPYQGDIKTHVAYAKRAMFDCLSRNEAPFLSHLLYTLVLDDTDEEDRRHGLFAAFNWMKKADYMVVYTDYGISPGMQQSINGAEENNKAIIFRSIGKNK